MTKSTLSKIEALARALAENAVKPDTAVEDQIEAVKVLGPYYLALKKAEGKPDDEDDETTMGDLQSQVRRVEQESGNGGTVSDRSRRRN